MSLVSGPTPTTSSKIIIGNSSGTYPNAATEYSLTISNGANVMVVKMWGAGGGTSRGSTIANGGNGGYVRFTKNIANGDVYNFSAGGQGNGSNTGNGGAGGASSGGPLQGGAGSGNGTNANGGSGGGGTIFTQLSGGTYTLLAIAGGGGGSGFRDVSYVGGAGGSTAGTNSTAFGTITGGGAGSNGTGGSAGNGSGGTAGTNVSGSTGTNILGTTATGSLSAFNGQGGTGAGPGGGGGYGGGGGGAVTFANPNTASGSASGAGGGGSYLATSTVYNGTSIVGNSGSFPNSTALDSDYISGKGLGSTSVNGGTGLIIILLIVPTIPLNPSTSYYSSLSSSMDLGVVGLKQNTVNNTNGVATTINSASSLFIAGPPIAGTNTTITNSLSLNVATGTSALGGGLTVGGGTKMQQMQFGNATKVGSTTYTITFPVSFSTTPTLITSIVCTNTTYQFSIQVYSLTNADFSYRLCGASITANSTVFAATDSHSINWIAMI